MTNPTKRLTDWVKKDSIEVTVHVLPLGNLFKSGTQLSLEQSWGKLSVATKILKYLQIDPANSYHHMATATMYLPTLA